MSENPPTQQAKLDPVGRRRYWPRWPLSGARDHRRWRLLNTRKALFKTHTQINHRDLTRELKMTDKRPVWWIISLLLLFILPLAFGSNTLLVAATTFALYASITLMWQLIVGTAGIYSMATMAVVGTAGYIAAWLSLDYGLSWPFMLLVGTLVGLVAGFIIGWPARNIDGLYFALLTLGLVELCRVYVQQSPIFGRSGGGLYGADTFIPLAWQSKTPGLMLGYVTTFILMLVMLGVFRLVNGQRLGLLIATARESEASAEAMGINYDWARIQVFMVSSAALGLIGGYYAAYYRGISPAVFSMDTLMLLFAMMVIGGLGSAEGAVLGTLIVVMIDKMFAAYGPIRFIVIGAIMLLVTMYARDGLLGIRHQWREFRNKKMMEHRAERTIKGGEVLPEEATVIRDKNILHHRRFDKALRDRLKALVTPELIDEHRQRPLGQHSGELERVLNYFRRAPVPNKYALSELEVGRQYKIVALTGEPGVPPRVVDDQIYTSRDDALHAVFLKRVQELMDS